MKTYLYKQQFNQESLEAIYLAEGPDKTLASVVGIVYDPTIYKMLKGRYL